MITTASTNTASTRSLTHNNLGGDALAAPTGTCAATPATGTNATATCNGDITTDEARNKPSPNTGTPKRQAENDEVRPAERLVASAEAVASSRQVASMQGAGMRDALTRALAAKNVG